MRDLRKYPLTTEECIKRLQEMKAVYEEVDACGDITPLVLQRAIEALGVWEKACSEWKQGEDGDNLFARYCK